MKKNRMMRLASTLLILTLLTTSAVSGTFAKYTTTASAKDTVRVAAWGFGDSEITLDLFDAAYNDTVVASNSDNLIAPGTKKETKIILSYEGTNGKTAPEVDYIVDLKVDTANTFISDAIKNNPNIKWGFNGVAYDKWDDMIAAINAYEEYVQANALPTIHSGVTIDWEWVFETSDAQNEADTDMGDAATLATCQLGIIITATQVD